MAIYVFSIWRPAAILDFGGCEIWRYFCFQEVCFSFCAKFYANMWNCDRIMAVKVNFQNGVRRHLGFFGSEFDVTGSRGRPVSTSTPNWVKISQRAAELWQFMCFQNGGRPPSLILADVKFGGISVSGTSVLVSVSNFMRICGIATELWPLK